MFSDWHWIVFFVIVLLVLGPKNLPKLAQAVGKSMRELKNGMAGLTDDIKDAASNTVEQRRMETKPPDESPRPATVPPGTVETTDIHNPKIG